MHVNYLWHFLSVWTVKILTAHFTTSCVKASLSLGLHLSHFKSFFCHISGYLFSLLLSQSVSLLFLSLCCVASSSMLWQPFCCCWASLFMRNFYETHTKDSCLYISGHILSYSPCFLICIL